MDRLPTRPPHDEDEGVNRIRRIGIYGNMGGQYGKDFVQWGPEFSLSTFGQYGKA